MNILQIGLSVGALLVVLRMVVMDFRVRRIEIIWLALFYGLSAGFALMHHGWWFLSTELLADLAFLGLYYLSVWGYLVWVGRKQKATHLAATARPSDAVCTHEYSDPESIPVSSTNHPIWNYIGAGDLLFLPALAFYFPLKGYVIFLIAAFLLSLAWWGIHYLIRREKVTIPLVGTVGTVFIVYSLFRFF